MICAVLGREKLKAGNIQVDPFRDFVETIVSGDSATAIRLLDASPLLAKECAVHGATRQAAKQNFFDQILHYMYEGDTALHIAAAAYQIRIAEELIARGADVRARNRRGAEPLHYAVDGGPGLPAWNPSAQTKIIARLIGAGADPNAVDKSGVAPLHRAVRNRCAAAVRRSSRVLTRVLQIGTALHRCFSQLRTLASAVQDQPRRRHSKTRYCVYLRSTEPRDRW